MNIEDISPEAFTAAIKSLELSIKASKVKMFSSQFGSGVFEVTKRVFETKASFTYKIHPSAKTYLLKENMRRWEGPGRTFDSAKDAVAHAHETFNVMLKQHRI